MMQRLEVRPAELIAFADRLDTAAEGISADLDALQDALDVLRLEWTGEAHETFDRAQTRYRLQLDARRLALVRLAAVARGLTDAYGETDRQASRPLGGQ